MNILSRADADLMVWLNGFHNSFFDGFMYLTSEKWVWVPVYMAIFFVILHKYGLKRQTAIIVLMFCHNHHACRYDLCGISASNILSSASLSSRQPHRSAHPYRERLSQWSLRHAVMPFGQLVCVSNIGDSALPQSSPHGFHLYLGSYSHLQPNLSRCPLPWRHPGRRYCWNILRIAALQSLPICHST